MLFVIPKLAAHTCRSLIAVRKPWFLARCSLCVTRFSLTSPTSVAAECLIFALRCSLIIYHSYLLASHTFFLNVRSSLKEVCCIPAAYCFSMLSSFFTLLTACCPVLMSGSMLLAGFSFIISCSLLFTIYSLLAAYALYLLRVLLIAAGAIYLLLPAQFKLIATGYSLNDGHISSSCSVADRRALLLDYCCSLYAIIALLARHLSLLLICVFRRSLHAYRSTMVAFCL